jgi:uncharacterized integral membrane protein
VIVVYLLMALVGATVTLFAAQNIDPVVIRFITWRIEGMPLALVILLSLLIGVVFASLSGAVRVWKLRSRVRQLEIQVAQLTAAQTAQPPSGGTQGPTLPS